MLNLTTLDISCVVEPLVFQSIIDEGLLSKLTLSYRRIYPYRLWSPLNWVKTFSDVRLPTGHRNGFTAHIRCHADRGFRQVWKQFLRNRRLFKALEINVHLYHHTYGREIRLLEDIGGYFNEDDSADE